MQDKQNLTYKQQYEQAQAECAMQLAVVQPWLKQFTEEYNKNHPRATMGTCMYDNGKEDQVRIITSPFGDFYWHTEAGKTLMERQKTGEIGLYYVYGAGSSFIIEYSPAQQAVFAYEGQLYQGVHREPVNAYFLYTEPYINAAGSVEEAALAAKNATKRAEVPMEVALAAQKLNSAQNYLGAVYGCMLEEERRGW